MARAVLAVLCQSAIVDSTTNNLSIINQLDELHPPTPPDDAPRDKNGALLMALPCTLVSVWERDKPEISEAVPMRIRIITPNKKAFEIVQATMDLRKHRRGRFVTPMPGFPVTVDGRYTFAYEIRRGKTWKRVTEVPLSLTFIRPQRRKAH